MADDKKPAADPIISEKQYAQAKDGIMAILSYVDSPFKLIVVIILGALGFVGYFVYTNQNLLISVYVKSQELPTLDSDKFDDAAMMLFKELKADTVAIFTVDPILNKRVLARAYAKDNSREKKIEGINVKLFNSSGGNNQDVIKLMGGETPCSDYSIPQSIVGLWYVQQGVKFTCRVSSPTSVESFVGQITVGWVNKPADLEYAKSVLNIISDMIVKEKR